MNSRLLLTLVLGVAASPAGAQEAGRERPHFVDVTQAKGMDRPHWDAVVPPGVSGGEIELLFMTAGACAGDIDGDGWTDLFVTRLNAPNLLYRNVGGDFVEVAHERGVASGRWSGECCFADIDDDGDLDLFVLTVPPARRAMLFVNDGLGFFTEEAEARGLHLFESFGASHRMTGATFADWDRDGDLDAFVCEWHPLNDKTRLYENIGGGRFLNRSPQMGVPSAPHFAFSPRFCDLDDDGWMDLLLASDFGTSGVYRNLGGGGFELMRGIGVGTDENGMGHALGDVDLDGRLDWFVTSIYDPLRSCDQGGCNWGYTGNRLYLNRTTPRGGIAFVDGTDQAGVREGYWGWGTSFLDYDNDGDPDLGMTNGVVFPQSDLEDAFNADPLRLWENDGTGRMREVSSEVGFVDDGSGKGFVVFDYDRDGDQDVFIANNALPPVLFENVGGNRGSWLRLALVGTYSSRQPIGARVFVQVKEGGPVQVQDLSPGTNYMSQNEPVLHFGLGVGVDRVHSVRVRWPRTGRESVLKDVPARRLLRIVEGREAAALK